jgi:mannitol-specific phosphotransferase system IIBC component
LAKSSAVSCREYATLTHIGFLGWHDTNRIISICVMSPKVVKVSTVVTVTVAVAVAKVFALICMINFNNVNSASMSLTYFLECLCIGKRKIKNVIF